MRKKYSNQPYRALLHSCCARAALPHLTLPCLILSCLALSCLALPCLACPRFVPIVVLRVQRANIERVKEFSANLRKINYDAAASRGGSLPPVSLHPMPRLPRLPEQGARRRALDFASKIPPPQRKPPSQATVDHRAMSRTEGSASAKPRDGLRSSRMTEPKTVGAVQDMRRKIEASQLPRGPQHEGGWECSSSQ